MFNAIAARGIRQRIRTHGGVGMAYKELEFKSGVHGTF
jgi:hypothetical protein